MCLTPIFWTIFFSNSVKWLAEIAGSGFDLTKCWKLRYIELITYMSKVVLPWRTSPGPSPECQTGCCRCRRAVRLPSWYSASMSLAINFWTFSHPDFPRVWPLQIWRRFCREKEKNREGCVKRMFNLPSELWGNNKSRNLCASRKQNLKVVKVGENLRI